MKRMFIIKLAYWLGIAADALWAVGLLVPNIFAVLTNNPDFNPDLQVKLIMGIAGSLMTGWTFLLIWAVRDPIERRVVILLTAFPVVFGLFLVGLIGSLDGDSINWWILIKTTILFVSMILSYFLANQLAKKEEKK